MGPRGESPVLRVAPSLEALGPSPRVVPRPPSLPSRAAPRCRALQARHAVGRAGCRHAARDQGTGRVTRDMPGPPCRVRQRLPTHGGPARVRPAARAGGPAVSDEVCRAAARPEPARPRAPPPQTTAGAARNKPACGPAAAACCLPRSCRRAGRGTRPAMLLARGRGGRAGRCRWCSCLAEGAHGRGRVCARLTHSPRVTGVWSLLQTGTSTCAGRCGLWAGQHQPSAPLQRGLELREQGRSMAWVLLRTSKRLEASAELAVRDSQSLPLGARTRGAAGRRGRPRHGTQRVPPPSRSRRRFPGRTRRDPAPGAPRDAFAQARARAVWLKAAHGPDGGE
jgi:hypothetical protein